MRIALFAFFLLGTAAMNASDAREPLHTPAPGSAERHMLLDVARAPLERALGQDVTFAVEALRVEADWAFLRARMQRADGGAVRYEGTRFATAATEGGMSQRYAALLHRDGGHWTLRAEAIGPTDPAWLTWPEEHGAPAALFAD